MPDYFSNESPWSQGAQVERGMGNSLAELMYRIPALKKQLAMQQAQIEMQRQRIAQGIPVAQARIRASDAEATERTAKADEIKSKLSTRNKMTEAFSKYVHPAPLTGDTPGYTPLMNQAMPMSIPIQSDKADLLTAALPITMDNPSNFGKQLAQFLTILEQPETIKRIAGIPELRPTSQGTEQFKTSPWGVFSSKSGLDPQGNPLPKDKTTTPQSMTADKALQLIITQAQNPQMFKTNQTLRALLPIASALLTNAPQGQAQGGGNSSRPLTATNPQTGQKIQSLDGGNTWQPIQ